MLLLAGRFDALDFEIQTVADLASMTPRSASRAFGRTDATLLGWPISTWVNKPEADPSIVEPIASESPYRTVATASSQSPLLRARPLHCRRTTLIVFYLIGAT
jgi:hypothetical protein